MSLRLTIFFNGGHTGWTETWYQAGTSTITSDPVASWDAIFKAAIKFRGKGTVIYGVRQAIFGTALKPSYFTKFGGRYVRPITDPSDQDPDVISTDALYYIYSPDRTSKRPVYLRGLVDADVKVDANFVDQPTTALTNNVKSYLNLLAGSGFGMQLVNKPATGINAAFHISSVEPDPANASYTRITVTTAMNLAVNDPLIFRGVKTNDLPGFPKVAFNKSLANPAALQFSIPYRYRASQPIYNPVNQTVQLYRVTVLSATTDNFQFWEFSEHKAGRPFGSLRGRKRSAVRAQ